MAHQFKSTYGNTDKERPMTNTATNSKRLPTLILWAIAWAAALIASAFLLKGNPIKDWVQAALIIAAMTFWVWQSQRVSPG
jgi:hypothetical protein